MSTQFNCQKNLYFKLFKQLYVIIQLSVYTFLFQIIQLSLSTQFKCKYGLVIKNISLVLFNP